MYVIKTIINNSPHITQLRILAKYNGNRPTAIPEHVRVKKLRFMTNNFLVVLVNQFFQFS